MVIITYSSNILKHSLCAKTYGRCWDAMANMPWFYFKDLGCLPGLSVGCMFKRTQRKGHQFFKRRQENGRGLISRGSTLLAILTPPTVQLEQKAEPHPALMNFPYRILSWQGFTTTAFSPEAWGGVGVRQRK